MAPHAHVTGSQPVITPTVHPEHHQPRLADGKYDFISHAVLVSVGWRFKSRMGACYIRFALSDKELARVNFFGIPHGYGDLGIYGEV